MNLTLRTRLHKRLSYATIIIEFLQDLFIGRNTTRFRTTIRIHIPVAWFTRGQASANTLGDRRVAGSQITIAPPNISLPELC